MSQEVARTGHSEMADLGPLLGEERKSDFGAVRSVDDPKGDMGPGTARAVPPNAISFWCYFHRTLEAFDASRPPPLEYASASALGQGNRFRAYTPHCLILNVKKLGPADWPIGVFPSQTVSSGYR
jgi:hypothetical protein